MTGRLVRLLATFGGVGYLPFAPGTFGSLAGLALAWFFYSHAFGIALTLSFVGFLIAPAAERTFAMKDPPFFVLDEVCGMLFSVLWLPKTFWIFLVAFVLFRLGDTLKPWPISLIQKNPSPASILWDDLAVGMGVNCLLQASVLFLL